ncbi:MAG TPA: PBP1A family penicillin-binding protein [Pyrinomonadaceae bacterium]|nr:PBP1A family penicillin-binding protein [Pyrinomonadaceae bacterium]
MRRRQHVTAARSRRTRLFQHAFRISAVLLLVITAATTLFLIHSYRAYAKLVDERLAHGYLTARAGIYAAPRTLRAGQKLTRDGLAAALRRSGYIESDAVSEVWNGSFTISDNAIEIRPTGVNSFPAVVRVEFDREGRISQLLGDDVSFNSITLAPESLTNDDASRGAARRQLTFKDIPPVLVQAIVSIEDRRFFEHHGLDIFGVARALIRNAGDERIGQGGSSITQQLVKNTYLTPERTFRRKYAEAMLAFSLERRLSKQDILALYCNEVYLGQRSVVAVRGVDQAARVYFGKELKDLNLNEAATIAGMIQGPSRYSPLQHNEDARARRNTVLGTMVRDGYITLEQAAVAAKEPLLIADYDAARESSAPYFIDYVNRQRATGVAPVENAQDARVTITTLDLDLQQLAEQAVQKQLARLDETHKSATAKPQAALVALDPHTGEVLAMIGGRDYAASQLNRATDAKRQPGSTFKPFVYAAALESGMSPLQKFADAPQEFTYAGSAKYHPANFGGRFSMRDVPMRDGLINSLNVVTVEVATQTGLARTANIANAFGLPRPEPYPALALGTTEVTPLQLAAAYATFANRGQRVDPHILKVAADDKSALQVIQPSTAFIVTDMLQGVIDHGTAIRARDLLKNSALAGKTGTSRDGWFVGYTPNLVCAVWVGFDDNEQLGMTGGEAALPIWMDFMKAAVDLRPELGAKFFAQPNDVNIVEVDPDTDQLATGVCPQHERVAILAAQSPSTECYRHNMYVIRDDEPPAGPIIAKLEPPLRRNSSHGIGEIGDTTVETETNGRRTLVNELRVATR